MYCAFCGKKLPDNEGCTCCRAVAARNDNPNYRDRKTIFKIGEPLEFDHGHENYKYKTDEHGKLDSCQYGGQDQHTRPANTYSSATKSPSAYSSAASPSKYTQTGQTSNTLRPVNQTEQKNAASNQAGCAWIFYIIIMIIIFAISQR